MSGSRGPGFLVRIRGVVARPLVLAAWSGSVVASWVYRGLGDRGGLARVSPLLVEARGGRWRPLISGLEGEAPLVVEEGRRVLVEAVLDGLAEPDTVLSVARSLEEWGIRPVEMSVEQVRIGRVSAPGHPAGDSVLVEAVYGPTIHVFRGRRVLYPSPARLLFSAARSLGEWLGRDLQGLARGLLERFELSGHRTRTVRLNIGRGRVVKAFHGEALFIASADALGDILVLLEAARIYGVGKSRSIGFGRFEYKLLEAEDNAGL